MTDQPTPNDDQTGGSTGQDQTGGSTGPDQQLAPPAAPAEPESKDISSLPKWAQTLINDTRKEAGDARVQAKEQAAEEARQKLAQDIGKALGLVKGDEKVDPDKLATDLQASQAETIAARRELAIYRSAAANGGDPDALLDSNSFLRSIESVDPTDTEKIAAAIKDAVKNNSKLSMAPRAGSKSGGDVGGSGERTVTQEAFDKMSGAERNKLYQTDPDLYARLSASRE